jgi:DNA-binding NarL/FixJ family response regulator
MTRILVADDSEVVRRGISRLLQEHQDWEVCGEAVDGVETVAKAQQLAPDVVILDFAMPVMNGLDAAREILKTHPKTEIVLCSMYLDSQLAALASDVGIRSLLSKSNVGKVIHGVEAALRGESFRESQI